MFENHKFPISDTWPAFKGAPIGHWAIGPVNGIRRNLDFSDFRFYGIIWISDCRIWECLHARWLRQGMGSAIWVESLASDSNSIPHALSESSGMQTVLYPAIGYPYIPIKLEIWKIRIPGNSIHRPNGPMSYWGPLKSRPVNRCIRFCMKCFMVWE